MKNKFFALVAAVLAGAFFVPAFSVSADIGDMYVLTPQQTLALYGNSFTADYYIPGSAVYGTATFTAAFPLSQVGYMDQGGGFSRDNSSGSAWYHSAVRNSIYDMQGVVYTCSIDNFPTENCPWSSNEQGLRFYNVQFEIDFPNFRCTEYKQLVGWSTGDWSYDHQAYGNSYQPYVSRTSWRAIYQNNSVQPNGTAERRTSSGSYAAYQDLPTYAYHENGNTPLDETQLTRFSFFNVDATIGSDTVLDKLQFGMQVNQQRVHGTGSGAPSGDLWLIVGCPTIYEYEEPQPAETTAPIVTTLPAYTTNPRETYPLATVPTDSPYYSIVYNQNINYYQIDDLIDHLDFWFNEINNHGELSLEWQNELMNIQTDSGRHLSIWNAEQSGIVENALTTYTYTTFDHLSYQGYKNTFQFFFDTFMQQQWIAQLAGLGLCLMVAYFVLFRKGAS